MVILAAPDKRLNVVLTAILLGAFVLSSLAGMPTSKENYPRLSTTATTRNEWTMIQHLETRYLKGDRKDVNSTNPSFKATNDTNLLDNTISSSVQWDQQQALQLLYDATAMSSRKSSKNHDWFDDKHKLDDDLYDYCSFEGIECTATTGEDSQADKKDEVKTTPTVKVVTGIYLEDKALSGSIPSAVFDSLDLLESLNLASNDLTGVIPQSLCSLTKVKVLDISDNAGMYGTIPACMESFSDLSVFKFDRVGLSGTIPSALCSPDRRMNGLYPNKFGCDVIACAMGTFEPISGRQKDKSAPCQPCPAFEDSVSENVTLLLGTTECPEIPSLAPSTHPSQFPSGYPSWRPSSAPSMAPSPFVSTPTRKPSHPIHFQGGNSSIAPTGLASTLTNTTANGTTSTSPFLTMAPSVNPTTSPNDHAFLHVINTLSVQVTLGGARRLLNERDEIQSMEDALIHFLRLQESKRGSEAAVIMNLTMTKQTLVSSSESPEKTGMSLTELPTPTRFRKRRKLVGDVDSYEVSLLLDFDIVVGTLATWNQSYAALVASWDKEMDGFAELVQNTVALSTLLLGPIDTGSTSPTKVQDSNINSNVGPSQQQNRPTWTLLWAALALCFLAVVAATLVQFTRWWHLHGKATGYKRHWNLSGGNSQTNSNNDPKGRPHSDKNTGSSSNSNSNSSDSQHEVDARSLFSCWKHWDTEQPVVSEESDSGWNSGSGSGSVPDSYLHGERSTVDGGGDGGGDGEDYKSMGGTSYHTRSNFDDVWSVSADHPLCTSESVGSCADDESGPLYLIGSENSIVVIATKDHQTIVDKP